MKTINVKLTDDEYEALQELFLIGTKCCESGCVWEKCLEAANKIKDEEKRYNYCYKCAFTRALAGLENKIFKGMSNE